MRMMTRCPPRPRLRSVMNMDSRTNSVANKDTTHNANTSDSNSQTYIRLDVEESPSSSLKEGCSVLIDGLHDLHPVRKSGALLANRHTYEHVHAQYQLRFLGPSVYRMSHESSHSFTASSVFIGIELICTTYREVPVCD
jgi:hypothetical protein